MKNQLRTTRSAGFKLAASAVLLGGLAACANDTVLRPVQLDNYDPNDLFYLAGKGPVKTQVVGNPFDEAKPEVDSATTSVMTGATFRPKLTFQIEVPPEQNSPYHVVMLLDAPGNARPEKLCANPEDANRSASSKTGEDKLRVVAVYCVNDRRLSSIAGTTARPASSSDPRFQKLIQQATLNLFPLDNPDRRDSNRLWRAR
ncbi:hypothetical protein [Denitrobaculum tricleocarpae]|uniref:Lipoprotein n=1 Tax=Denitrobaculum tricleocarpae TaxID=2591009 RepID=A0A545TPC4_9PROT|nr:hypothetical protein [Denitrobaculum tricleocarpae]TQV79064.1 hypothetical protein FKG95_15410 [Denitrobaculum tricleocarpae]